MIENLIFSGGSIRGISFIGVLKYLEEKDIIKDIKNISGVSIGACFSFCILLGYNSSELSDIFLKIDLEKFRDINSDSILLFFEKFGIDSGNNIFKTLKILLYNKLKKDDITFQELYDLTDKNLNIAGTCLNTMNVEYFNKETYPDMSVLTALKISYSIPFLFNPVIYNEKYYVDGSVTDNYPANLYENNNEKTIGFVLTSNSIYNCKIENMENFLLSVVWTTFANNFKDKIEKYSDITIKINVDIDSFDFSISEQQKEELINLGYEQSKEQFNEKYSDLKTT